MNSRRSALVILDAAEESFRITAVQDEVHLRGHLRSQEHGFFHALVARLCGTGCRTTGTRRTWSVASARVFPLGEVLRCLDSLDGSRRLRMPCGTVVAGVCRICITRCRCVRRVGMGGSDKERVDTMAGGMVHDPRALLAGVRQSVGTACCHRSGKVRRQLGREDGSRWREHVFLHESCDQRLRESCFR